MSGKDGKNGSHGLTVSLFVFFFCELCERDFYAFLKLKTL